jgi:hypothetical protein
MAALAKESGSMESAFNGLAVQMRFRDRLPFMREVPLLLLNDENIKSLLSTSHFPSLFFVR